MRFIKQFFGFFQIDYEKLHNSKTEGLFWLDILMMVLIMFNLSWIVFEYAFQYAKFQSVIEWISPMFYHWYDIHVHPDFFLYDLVFVAIFVVELVFRWSRAIHLKTYEKWFFYPFIHWYDVLGCIPLSSFRALRLFRVFSMVLRLQRHGIIDMTSTYFYRQFNKYLIIFTEEISDRVVINVLNGVQDEVSKGSPVVEKVIREVLMPRQHIIATWAARRMGVITLKTFEKNEHILKRVIDDSISESMRNNKEIARLKFIPGAGALITDILNNSVKDVTFNTIKRSVEEMSNPENNAGMINDVSHLLMETLIDDQGGDDQSLDDLVSSISVEVIEVIKDEVRVKQWKVAEEERKQLKKNLKDT